MPKKPAADTTTVLKQVAEAVPRLMALTRKTMLSGISDLPNNAELLVSPVTASGFQSRANRPSRPETRTMAIKGSCHCGETR